MLLLCQQAATVLRREGRVVYGTHHVHTKGVAARTVMCFGCREPTVQHLLACVTCIMLTPPAGMQQGGMHSPWGAVPCCNHLAPLGAAWIERQRFGATLLMRCPVLLRTGYCFV